MKLKQQNIMKKLRIKIGNETHELPYSGEEVQIEVIEKYVPKVGDCVKVECIEPNNTYFYWLKVKEVVSARVEFSWAVEENFQISKNGFLNISSNRIYTQITPEELKAKYAEAGYDWDYETNEVKPIKWNPKDGDEIWMLNAYYEPIHAIYDNKNRYFLKIEEKGLLFPNEEKCKEFSEHCLSYSKKE